MGNNNKFELYINKNQEIKFIYAHKYAENEHVCKYDII